MHGQTKGEGGEGGRIMPPEYATESSNFFNM